jgi:hypothetical protein
MQTVPQSPGAGLIPFPDTPERRLRRALGALDAALAAQRSAVADFRAQIEVLRDEVTKLDGSARALTVSLACAAEDTVRAQAASRALILTAARLEQAVQP